MDSAGNAACEMADTVPCRETVTLGRVNVNGRVDTEAMCTGDDASVMGSNMETSKGRDGLEKSRSYGTGLIAVAVPWRESASDSEEILKEVRVTSLDTEGKGKLPPGAGTPGIKGTGKKMRKSQCNARDSEKHTLQIYERMNTHLFPHQ